MAQLIVRRSETFEKWIRKMATSDRVTYRRIASHLDRIEIGNLGDWKMIGDGVSEMRLKFGPGYRVYFTRQGTQVVLLLVGGDKSTQDADIAKAKAMVKHLA
jgi:putative addiction module killer protein